MVHHMHLKQICFANCLKKCAALLQSLLEPECWQALRDVGFQPAKPLEVIMFATEEASRFSVPCLGRC